MLSELIALVDTSFLLIAAPLAGALVAGVFAGMAIEQYLSRMRQQVWRERNGFGRSGWRGRFGTARGPWQPAPEPPGQPDAADQLRIVMGASFTIQPVLNRDEARVFKELDRIVAGRNPRWQVMAQVSLGEVLRSADADAYRCINAKRVDLLLMDEDCRPRHAIEYQGAAHHQGNAAARDAVKKEALRRAGVGYHEIVAGQTTPAELRRLVEKLIDDAAVSRSA